MYTSACELDANIAYYKKQNSYNIIAVRSVWTVEWSVCEGEECNQLIMASGHTLHCMPFSRTVQSLGRHRNLPESQFAVGRAVWVGWGVRYILQCLHSIGC